MQGELTKKNILGHLQASKNKIKQVQASLNLKYLAVTFCLKFDKAYLFLNTTYTIHLKFKS